MNKDIFRHLRCRATCSYPKYVEIDSAITSQQNLYIVIFSRSTFDSHLISFESTTVIELYQLQPNTIFKIYYNLVMIPGPGVKFRLITIEYGYLIQSYQPKKSTTRNGATWIIKCTLTKQLVIGYISTSTPNGSSYRAELFGIYAGLYYIW